MRVDLLVTNANVLTMDDARPHATSFAARDGRFVAIDQPIDAVETYDAGGATVVPGFHDCHLHLLWHGINLVGRCDLVGCASVDELCDRLREFARTADGWILGHGFDQERLGRFPTRADLDRISVTRPMLVTRICGHAAVANSAAIALLDPVERAAGSDHGLFTEGDIDAFHRRVPTLDEATLDRALLAACDAALASGITSVQTLLDTAAQMATYERVRARLGRLPIRVVAMPPQSAAEEWASRGQITGVGDEWLRVGGAKFFSDGSLGARTALLTEPYADGVGVGLRIYLPDELKRRVSEVAALGFQIVVHAIGDQALRETLDAIEHSIRAGACRPDSGPGRSGSDRRHRIEHASVCPPDQLARLRALDVGVSLQPQFVTSDTWTGERLGRARSSWAYPFRAMLAAGVRVGLSSDAPVERLDAFECLAAAVGRAAWSADGCLTPLEAIRAYTLGSAWLADREHDVGSIEVGKLADFVVLSGDPTSLGAGAIRALRAKHVFVGGSQAR